MNQQREIGFFIKVIHDTIKTQANARFKQFDITLTQSRMLRFLIKNQGSASYKELADYFQIKHSTLNGILGRLEAKSYVQVTVNEQDRRNRDVLLTEKGEEVHRQMVDQIRAEEEALTAGLSPEEITTLSSLLSRIYHNITDA